MQLPLQLDTASPRTLQSQIFEQIRGLVVQGCLKPGTRMPASRALSSDLGVSRNTIVQAYDALIAEGYLESRQPVGTFVASHILLELHGTPRHAAARATHTAQFQRSAASLDPHRTRAHATRSRLVSQPAKTRTPRRLKFQGQAHIIVPAHDPAPAYDFWVGRPDSRLFPIKEWMRLMRSKLRDMQIGNSAYVAPAGLPALRQAIADHVGAARGIRTTASHIVVVNGTQEALTLLAHLFVREGVRVAIENPCYLGAANVFASHGADLCPVPVDDYGMNVRHLPEEAALVYLTPSHQYPTGVTLAPARRRLLLEWARAHDAYLIEDDYNSDFMYDQAPLPALKSQDTSGHVIYLGTFSKSLGAGLRSGYMVLPDHLVAPATRAKGLLNNCSAWAVQALLAEFLSSGAYAHHLRRIRTAYAVRRNTLIQALQRMVPDSHVTGQQCGMHVICRLPDEWPRAEDLEIAGRALGVAVYSIPSGNARLWGRAMSDRHARTLMLGYAALDEAQIHEGLRRLVECASELTAPSETTDP